MSDDLQEVKKYEESKDVNSQIYNNEEEVLPHSRNQIEETNYKYPNDNHNTIGYPKSKFSSSKLNAGSKELYRKQSQSKIGNENKEDILLTQTRKRRARKARNMKTTKSSQSISSQFGK